MKCPLCRSRTCVVSTSASPEGRAAKWVAGTPSPLLWRTSHQWGPSSAALSILCSSDWGGVSRFGDPMLVTTSVIPGSFEMGLAVDQGTRRSPDPGEAKSVLQPSPWLILLVGSFGECFPTLPELEPVSSKEEGASQVSANRLKVEEEQVQEPVLV